MTEAFAVWLVVMGAVVVSGFWTLAATLREQPERRPRHSAEYRPWRLRLTDPDRYGRTVEFTVGCARRAA